jgi:iron complex outermembrane receptor protein
MRSFKLLSKKIRLRLKKNPFRIHFYLKTTCIPDWFIERCSYLEIVRSIRNSMFRAFCVGISMHKKWQLPMGLWLAGVVIVAQPAWAEGKTTRISNVNEIEHPATTVSEWLSQANIPQTPISVTGVKANPTDKGVEVILQTSFGQQLQVVNRSTGNSFIADIPNAQLRLPSGDAFTFRSNKPLAGITEITVTNFDANTIRVTVIGEGSVPTVELSDSPQEGLIFSVASASTSTPPQQQPQTPQQPEQEQPGSQTQPSQPSAQQGDEPIELVVTGEQDGYRAPNASTATKTDTPLRDIPASVDVVPRQLIQDRQVTRVQQATDTVAGVQPAQSYGGLSSAYFFIRGFASSTTYRDGFRDFGFLSPIDVANIDRLEILKGPASVLYGQNDPGGIVNIVSKRPLQQPRYEASFTAGSYNFYRPTLDFSGPLNSEKTAAYRLNLAYENAGSFRDFNESESIFVAPAFSWQIGKNTNITFLFEYQNYQYAFG